MKLYNTPRIISQRELNVEDDDLNFFQRVVIFLSENSLAQDRGNLGGQSFAS
jgi:hypothetical protein